MKRPLCKLSVCEEITINILNHLPSKSLARFKCVSKDWPKYIAEIYRSRQRRAQPCLVGFFCVETSKHLQNRFIFSSRESPLLIGTSLDDSLHFIGERVNIVASSNGFLLCNKLRSKLRSRQRVYYIYNPATRQRLDIPKTQKVMKDPYVGFICKVDDPDKDVVSFTIVRYQVPDFSFYTSTSITIESFSSDTNVWATNDHILDVPQRLCRSRDMTSSSSAGVIDGVFYWLDSFGRLITLYDSVHKGFWTLELPQQMDVHPSSCCLGLSGGALYFAVNDGTAITVWQLVKDIRSGVGVWVRKYVAKDFVFGGNTILEIQNMVIHPAVPHILYFHVRGKVIIFDFVTCLAVIVYDFGEHWRRTHNYKLFSYEWHQWPRLL